MEKIKLLTTNDSYYAVINESYYKINYNSYLLLDKKIQGFEDEHISKEMGVSIEELSLFWKNIIKISETKSKNKTILELGTIMSPALTNRIGAILSILVSTKIFIATAVAFLFFLTYYFSQIKISLIYSEITYIHYFLCLGIICLWHEFGHIAAAYKCGIRDLKIKMGLFFILPSLFVSLNQMNILPRKERLLINSAGVVFQMYLIMVLFFSYLIFPHDIFLLMINLNILLIAINLIPFLITDGYWIYSDFFRIENLNKKGKGLLFRIIQGKKKISDIPFPLLVYTLFRNIVSIIFVFYLIRLVYKRILYFDDMFALIVETNFEPLVLFRLFIFLLPIICLTTYLIKLSYGIIRNKRYNS